VTLSAPAAARWFLIPVPALAARHGAAWQRHFTTAKEVLSKASLEF